MALGTLYRLQCVGIVPRSSQFGPDQDSVKFTFGQRAHQSTEVIGLLQFTLANLDDIREVLANMVKQLAPDGTFPEE